MSPKTSPLVPLTNYARTAARRLRQLAWVYVLNLGSSWNITVQERGQEKGETEPPPACGSTWRPIMDRWRA